jgi:outer membrane receptor protein involved in Fe transport
MPVSPKEKYWASVEYTFPDFLPWAGDFWTRFSYTYQGKVWDSLGAIEDFELAETDEERAEALEFYLPAWKSGTFQIGFTSESGWDAALIVRNVFDDASYSYLSGTWYGEDFTGVNADGDPRWRHVRTLQRPQSVYLSFSKKW